MQSRILLVDDDSELVEQLAEMLRRAALSVVTAGSVAQAKSMLAEQRFDVIVTDYNLHTAENGADLLAYVEKYFEAVGRVVWSASVLPDGVAAHAWVDKTAPDTLLKVVRALAPK